MSYSQKRQKLFYSFDSQEWGGLFVSHILVSLKKINQAKYNQNGPKWNRNL